MRILVCGSRYWTDEKMIHDQLEKYKIAERSVATGGASPLRGTPQLENVILITGGCRGADIIAENIGRKLGFTNLVFPADWSIGKSAGPIRNRKMLEEGKPDLVLVFHEDLNNSKGTKHMLSLLNKTKIPVKIFQ